MIERGKHGRKETNKEKWRRKRKESDDKIETGTERKERRREFTEDRK